jgi:hypothetical protein
MAFPGASGSAAGYNLLHPLLNFIINIMMFLGNTAFIFNMLCLVHLDDYASTGYLVPFNFVIIMILIFENTSFTFVIMSVMLQLCKTIMSVMLQLCKKMFHICFGSIICLIIMLTFVMNCFCLFIHEFTLLFIAFFLWIKINMKNALFINVPKT